MGHGSQIGTVIWSKTRRETCGRHESDKRRDYERLWCAFREHFPCRGVWGQLKSRSAHDTQSAYHGDAFRAPRGIEGASAAISSNAADPPWFYNSVFGNLQVGAKSE